jgi:hypothetical protein
MEKKWGESEGISYVCETAKKVVRDKVSRTTYHHPSNPFAINPPASERPEVGFSVGECDTGETNDADAVAEECPGSKPVVCTVCVDGWVMLDAVREAEGRAHDASKLCMLGRVANVWEWFDRLNPQATPGLDWFVPGRWEEFLQHPELFWLQCVLSVMTDFVQKSALFVPTVGKSLNAGLIVAALSSCGREMLSEGIVLLAWSLSDGWMVGTEEVFATRLGRLTGAFPDSMATMLSTVWLVAICIGVLVELFDDDIGEMEVGRLGGGISKLT